MRNYVFLFCGVVTFSVAQAYGTDGSASVIRKVDKVEITLGTPLRYKIGSGVSLQITWGNAFKTVRHLQKLEIVGKPNNPTQVCVRIPGKIENQAVLMCKEFLNGVNDNNVRLFLSFSTINGEKVKWPADCSNLCLNSTALWGIDFTNTNTDQINIKSMNQMFYGCTNLQKLNLSAFDERAREKIIKMLNVNGNKKIKIITSSYEHTKQVHYQPLSPEGYNETSLTTAPFSSTVTRNDSDTDKDTNFATTGTPTKNKSEDYSNDNTTKMKNFVYRGGDGDGGTVEKGTPSFKSGVYRLIESATVSNTVNSVEQSTNAATTSQFGIESNDTVQYSNLIEERCNFMIQSKSITKPLSPLSILQRQCNFELVSTPKEVRIPLVCKEGAIFTKQRILESTSKDVVMSATMVKPSIETKGGYYTKLYTKAPEESLIQFPLDSKQLAAYTKVRRGKIIRRPRSSDAQCYITRHYKRVEIEPYKTGKLVIPCKGPLIEIQRMNNSEFNAPNHDEMVLKIPDNSKKVASITEKRKANVTRSPILDDAPCYISRSRIIKRVGVAQQKEESTIYHDAKVEEHNNTECFSDNGLQPTETMVKQIENEKSRESNTQYKNVNKYETSQKRQKSKYTFNIKTTYYLEKSRTSKETDKQPLREDEKNVHQKLNLTNEKSIADVDEAKKNSLHNLRNELNQVYWRTEASNRINDPELEEEHEWIKQDRYWESIVKVIGKAIGDCVTGQGVFANKKAPDDLITFEGTNPELYARRHRNAEMLYNFVGEMIGGEHTDENQSNEVLDICCTKIIKHYLEEYANVYDTKKKKNKLIEEINKSKNDIARYNNALSLHKYLKTFKTCALQYKKNRSVENIAPGNMVKDHIFCTCVRKRNEMLALENRYYKSYFSSGDNIQISKIDYGFYRKKACAEDNLNYVMMKQYDTQKEIEEIEKNCGYIMDLYDGLVKFPER